METLIDLVDKKDIFEFDRCCTVQIKLSGCIGFWRMKKLQELLPQATIYFHGDGKVHINLHEPVPKLGEFFEHV